MSPQYIQAQFQKSWDKLYGGNSYDELHEIYEVSDGYIMMGSASFSFFADFPLTNGLSDYWLYKTDFDGNIDWSYTYGSDSTEIFQTGYVDPIGNCLMGGFSYGNIAGEHSGKSNGGRDFWVIKTDAIGNFLWDFSFGGSKEDYLVSMAPTMDGGTLLAGWTNSPISGDITEASRGYFDYLIVKIDGNGNLLWHHRFGGAKDDRGFCVKEASDGNIYFGGGTNSGMTGDKSMASFGNNDCWLIKLDGNGNLIWDKTYGGNRSDQPFEIIETSDNNLILACFSHSIVSGNKTAVNYGGTDYWLIKMDFDGNMIWDKSYGGIGNDDLHSIKEVNKGNFVLSGTSQSPLSNDKSEPNLGDRDYWMVITDKDGNFLYDKTFGGSKKDELKVVLQTKDNGLLLGGYTLSSAENDVTDVSKGYQDNWVIKMDCDLEVNLPKDTMICYNQVFDLDANPNYDNICQYDWNTGVKTPSTSILVTSDTVISVTIMDAFGCVASDSFHVNVIPLPPVDLGFDQIICPDETIFLTESSSFAHTWSDNSMGNALEVVDSGTYSLILTNSLGCTNEDFIHIAYYDVAETKLQVDICEGDSFFVEGALQNESGIYHDTLNTIHLCDSVITTQLIVHSPDTSYTNDYVCNESQLDTLSNVFTNRFGCDSLVYTILLLAPKDSTIFDEYTCDIDNETVWIDTVMSQYNCDSFLIHKIHYVPPDTTQIEKTTCDITLSGVDIVQLSNYHSCDSFIITTTRYIPPDTVEVDQPTCFLDDIGVFHDTLSNFYGCDSFVTRNVILQDLLYETKIDDITCPGENNGQISVNINLGTPPYRYRLGDDAYQLASVFTNLAPGDYQLTILDGNGCEWLDSIALIEPEFIDFNVELPILLQYGDSIHINPTYSVVLDTFYWTEQTGISCLDCIDPVLSPEFQSLYQLDFMVGNCHVTRYLPVTVFHDRNVYFPSAFTPNGDGANDFFTIFASKEVEMIEAFNIYDRWGSLVYKRKNFTTGEDSSVPWDGTFDGKPLSQGVYSYYVLIRFSDGKRELFEGDITLMR